MNSLIFSLLLGAQGGAEGGGSGSIISTFVPFILIIGIFYFLIIRPQNKKQKETQKMLNAIKKGDKIVTIGGIHGVIQTVKESTVVVKIDESVKVEFSRSAIATVVADGGGKAEKVEKIEDKKTETSDDKPAQEGGAEDSKN
ncbi:preprotein translocase, YajC subunit [Treponema primitia ZAS-2]|uniref:Sec translocon accessory complex subunit YajC n=1 Tax=Treponema primitia (strain ATCC BAA-887 / DSM 12427 / ZAS-2) TaxID=545694 RepID=F5YPF5_TREPZ|nr:preprotein translocase subunit YajC [Treponema primitia]AEF85175.1 preprotein translocase, YajC subunit [Treponema primitia ZAS-2]